MIAWSWLNPGRWLLYIALAAALVVGARALEARIEARGDAAGYARAQAEYTQAALAAEQAHRAREQQLQAQIEKAVQDANQRHARLARDAAAARAERDGLRDDLTAARGAVSTAAESAVREYAAAATVVLQQCAGELEAMARAADAHAADTVTLLQAWPR